MQRRIFLVCLCQLRKDFIVDNVSLGSPSKTQLVGLIVERIESEIDDLRMAFINSREVVGTGFVVIDNLLPE